jgi:DNA-binding NarL/FixJ family response regulator
MPHSAHIDPSSWDATSVSLSPNGEPEPIRVIIVDDQELFRRGLTMLMDAEPGLDVVGEAGDGATGIELAGRVAPDVVLLDVRMPKGDAIFVLESFASPPPTILLTTFDDEQVLLAGIRAGARGYLLKDISLELLLDAVRRVHAGESLLRPAITEQALRALTRSPADFPRSDLPQPLTRRERQVLRLMAGGHSNREIADVLATSEGTIKNHVSNILQKLGVRDRTRAVLRGLELGVI